MSVFFYFALLLRRFFHAGCDTIYFGRKDGKKFMDNLILTYSEGILTAKLSGDMDHHGTSAVREEIDKELYLRRPGVLVLDLSGVEFMDSSGLGLILGRYEKSREIGTKTMICCPSPRTKRLLSMTGIDKMIAVKEEVNK